METQYIEINSRGSKYHYKDKQMTILHRTDGPAIEWQDGWSAWALNGDRMSEKEFNLRTAPEIVLTMDEIAAKLGVDVSKLKIVK